MARDGARRIAVQQRAAREEPRAGPAQPDYPGPMTPTTQTTEAGTAGTTPAAAQRTFIPVERGGGRVDSETGTLREVIVHRPGREIARVTYAVLISGETRRLALVLSVN